MKLKGIWLIWIGLLSSAAWSQIDSLELNTRHFYAALNKGDSLGIATYFHHSATISHVGQEDAFTLSLSDFLGVAPKFKSDFFSEEITRMELKKYASGLCYVDVYFDFYIEGSYAHSGVDHLCYTTIKGELKIASVYSSEFEEPKLTEISPDSLMNQWHLAAANANFNQYFGFMNQDFIFLGTDPGERWTKVEFAGFCKPYFDKGKAWDFKTNWRNWYYSADGQTAWFEESLDTWMEECRGSGVLIKVNGEWKIAHYNLTALIENEKMDGFIELRQK